MPGKTLIPARCRLYLITPPDLGHGGPTPKNFAKTLAGALDGGDVACVQLRIKDADDDTIRHAAEILRPVVQDRDVAFIMNDRPDLAVELSCDGVHVGQTDADYAAAREAVGTDAIVGVTNHASRDLAVQAAEAGADYVAFGAFFESTTKQIKHAADPKILVWWQENVTLPCVAIGGIKVKNCEALVEAGADFLAVAGGVWNHEGGAGAAVREFNEIFDRLAPKSEDPAAE